MSNIKPCPFCGDMPKTSEKIQDYGARAACKNHTCGLSRMGSFSIHDWNRRTPVDPDQVMRDNITTHNEPLRIVDFYQIGYEGARLPIWCSDDEEAEYNNGHNDRQREKGDE